MKKIAFFDFDGTITSRDTMLEFIAYVKGRRSLYYGMLALLPWLLAFKACLITNQRAKEKLLSYFFKGWNVQAFNLYCEKFIREKLPQLLRPDALREIRSLQANGFKVVVVSASPENWIQSWASNLHMACMASRMQVHQQQITGKLEGLNCHGEEKVRRIRMAYDLNEYDVIYAYGDDPGDRPMLNLANQSFYRPFRNYHDIHHASIQ